MTSYWQALVGLVREYHDTMYRKAHRAKYLQPDRRAHHLCWTECLTCEGTSAIKTVRGDQAKMVRCPDCTLGEVRIDFDEHMSYADEWTWHGSNEEKD